MRAVHVKTPAIMCGECTAKIENALGVLPGVISVTASQSGGRTSVMYDESATEHADIVRTLDSIGFEVED